MPLSKKKAAQQKGQGAAKTFARVKSPSRSELVIDKITNSIINGELVDGELLPSENKLCEIFGVSRSILREAVRVLAAKGLVEVVHGSGTYVRLPKISVPEEAVRNYLLTHSFSLEQLMEVRMPIELEIARWAALRREDVHIQSMEEAMRIMRSESFTDEEKAEADGEFHKAIIAATSNPLFGIMISSIMVNLHISRIIAIRHFGIDSVIKEHEIILEAVKNNDPEAASAGMRVHMEHAMERINKVSSLLKERRLDD